MKLYKLTDQNGNTQNNTNWIKTKHTKDPVINPQLCSADVFHAYTNPNLALLLNPIHADIANPRMFKCEGKVVVEDWGKVGCYTLNSKKELSLPKWYTNKETRKQVSVMFAVLCAESVLHIYEEYAPEDTRVRKAIEAAKEYLNTGNNVDAYADAADATRAAYAAADATRAAYAARAAYADATRAAYAAADAAAAAADAARAAATRAADAAAAAARAAADAADAAADAARAAADAADFSILADTAVKLITKK